jgi:nucleotide-binding universal stress UspA family protein
MYTHILVPLDGSELAEAALPHAVEIARCMGSQLSLLRVTPMQVVVASPAESVALYAPEVLELEREEAAKYLAHLRIELTAPGLSIHTAVITGAIVETIIDYAREQRIDLIVMSTHGRGGLSRVVFGSVADQVLRGAHCPTLLVRSHAAQDEASANKSAGEQ